MVFVSEIRESVPWAVINIGNIVLQILHFEEKKSEKIASF